MNNYTIVTNPSLLLSVVRLLPVASFIRIMAAYAKVRNVFHSPRAEQQSRSNTPCGPANISVLMGLCVCVCVCLEGEVRGRCLGEGEMTSMLWMTCIGNVSIEMTQRPFWNLRGHKVCPRQHKFGLIADICEVWSPAPSILVGSQYFIFPHFSERGKYDSTHRLLNKCVA